MTDRAPGSHGARLVPPGQLLNELAHGSRQQHPPRTGKIRSPGRPVRYGGILTVVTGALLAVAMVGGGGLLAYTDGGSWSVEVPDRTGYAAVTTTAGALVEYIGDQNTSFGSSGTGVFDSFVRVQADPTEKGYNTNGTLEWDTKSGKWTHAIKVSDIPVISIGGVPHWELFSDINDGNNTPKISLNDLEVWFTGNPNLTGYPFGGNATLEYDFAGEIKINDVNQGSGRGDLRYSIPIDKGITIPADCGYKNPACATWFVLYSQWGTSGGAYGSDGGFEEWKVKQYPYVNVTKTATPTFTRSYTWDIDKSVDETEVEIAEGDDYTFNYDVEVSHDAGTDSAWAVSGTISITNPGKDAAKITSVTDVISGVGGVAVSCGVSFPYTLASNATLNCTYSSPLSDATSRTNTATVMLDYGGMFTGTAGITFGDPTTEIDECIDVDDTYAGFLGTVCVGDDNPTTFEYSRTESGVAGTCTDYDNTASFETNDTATTGDDDVTVEICVGSDLTVSKDAAPAFTRTYDWDITKDVDGAASATIDIGGSATFYYVVQVSHDAGTDSAWALSGTIRVTNPNDWQAIVADVTDAVDNGGVCVVTGGDDVSVAASSYVDLAYSCTYASAPNPASGTNTATATWSASTYNTPNGSATGTAAADFTGSPTSTIDECIDVDDSFDGSLPGYLGTVCVGAANPSTFNYSNTVTPADYGGECGTFEFDNTASFETNDTQATGSDSETVTVNVNCAEGCTPGYWKNHLDSWVGYSPSDTVDPVFDVPNAFGLDDDTFLEALSYPGGDDVIGAAQILLRAGVAALLNASNPSVGYSLSGADVISMVNTALATEDRSAMLALASTLDAYNNYGCPIS